MDITAAYMSRKKAAQTEGGFSGGGNMITALAWVITAGFAIAVPFAWARVWRSPWPWARPWATTWTLTAILAVMELWMAEYRLGLAETWKAAYLIAADKLQQCQLSRLIPPAQSSTRSDSYFLCAADRPFANQSLFEDHQFGVGRQFRPESSISQGEGVSMRLGGPGVAQSLVLQSVPAYPWPLLSSEAHLADPRYSRGQSSQFELIIERIQSDPTPR